MGFNFIKKLPTPAEIRNQYPIDAEIQALKEKHISVYTSVEKEGRRFLMKIASYM